MDTAAIEHVATVIAIIIAAAILAFDRLGLLERFGLRKRSSTDAAAELSIAEHTIARLRIERNAARIALQKLEQTRSLEPVVELIATVAGICEQTLDKLGNFNGSLRHIEEGLAETREGLADTTEGIRTLVGLIAELHDLPVTQPGTRRRRPQKAKPERTGA
jgi:hypothetical protein